MGEAGIRVTVVPEEQKQVLTVVRSRRHQMTASEWSPDYMDPQTNAGNFASNPVESDAPPERTSAWRNHWVIPELSRLTREAAAEHDIAKRAILYQSLQRRVMVEGPFIMVFQATQATARRRAVNGFALGFINDLTFYRDVTKQ
jgi:peptide/nickel transport system substrate-binding protein